MASESKRKVLEALQLTTLFDVSLVSGDKCRLPGSMVIGGRLMIFPADGDHIVGADARMILKNKRIEDSTINNTVLHHCRIETGSVITHSKLKNCHLDDTNTISASALGSIVIENNNPEPGMTLMLESKTLARWRRLTLTDLAPILDLTLQPSTSLFRIYHIPDGLSTVEVLLVTTLAGARVTCFVESNGIEARVIGDNLSSSWLPRPPAPWLFSLETEGISLCLRVRLISSHDETLALKLRLLPL